MTGAKGHPLVSLDTDFASQIHAFAKRIKCTVRPGQTRCAHTTCWSSFQASDSVCAQVLSTSTKSGIQSHTQPRSHLRTFVLSSVTLVCFIISLLERAVAYFVINTSYFFPENNCHSQTPLIKGVCPAYAYFIPWNEI